MDSCPRLTTLFQVLEDSVRVHGTRELFGTRNSGRWQWITYSEFGNQVDKLRGGLASLGVRRGDRVAIISNNHVEWAVAAFACYSLAAVFVPMYEAQNPVEWDLIVRESEAKVIFVANRALFDKARTLATVETLSTVVVLDAPCEPAPVDGPGAWKLTSYAKLLTAPPAAPCVPAADDIAVLIYTSGTMGTPKGVRLSHLNIASNLSAIHEVFKYETSDRSLAFLPWAHVYGQTAELYLLMSCGSSIAICEGPDRILDNLAEVRPTVLIGVPRVFNKIYVATQQQFAARPKAVQQLVSAALNIASRKREGQTPRAHESVLLKLVDHLVFRKVRARVGGRLRIASSGGAALSREVSAFFDTIGIPVYDGYGLTETSPVVSINIPGARRVGTVGRPLPGVRVAIAHGADGHGAGAGSPEGEIVVYGPNVMKGYFKRGAETAAAFTSDGGFRTGDVGSIDADGYLSITGRIKEHYKLENGKYVVPTPLEEMLKLSPYVSNVMVYGENRPFNVALVAANVPAVRQWAQTRRLTLPEDNGAVLRDARIRSLFESEISRLSASFKRYEAIAAFALIATDFATETGMLTPKLSLKRGRIADAYGELIAQLYREESAGPRSRF